MFAKHFVRLAHRELGHMRAATHSNVKQILSAKLAPVKSPIVLKLADVLGPAKEVCALDVHILPNQFQTAIHDEFQSASLVSLGGPLTLEMFSWSARPSPQEKVERKHYSNTFPDMKMQYTYDNPLSATMAPSKPISWIEDKSSVFDVTREEEHELAPGSGLTLAHRVFRRYTVGSLNERDEEGKKKGPGEPALLLSFRVMSSINKQFARAFTPSSSTGSDPYINSLFAYRYYPIPAYTMWHEYVFRTCDQLLKKN